MRQAHTLKERTNSTARHESVKQVIEKPIITAREALKAAFAPGSKHKPDAKKMLEYSRRLHVKIDSYLMMVTI